MRHSLATLTAMKPIKSVLNRYILFYKPYGVLSQFTPEHGHKTLKDFGPFPPDVYPVGRLDLDSEGLLFLTDDNKIKQRASNPNFEHPKTYWVQVENIPDAEALRRLQTGVVIEGKKTKPAGVRLLENEPDLPARSVPIRFRKNIPTAWLEITLREGRNRQIRKMTAAVGHPTLRLVRVKFGELTLDGLQVGESRPMTEGEISVLQKLLKILETRSKTHKKRI